MSTEKQELIAYLDRQWSEDAHVFLTVKKDENTDKGVYKVLPISGWGAKKDLAIDRVLALVAQGYHVYYSPVAYVEGSETNEKSNIRGSKVLWADFDGNAQTVWKNFPKGIPKPTWRNQTGPDGHEHWYWLLDREYTLEEFEPINRRLTYALNADSGCWNGNQVLRPIHTRNFKTKYLKPPYNLAEFPTVSTFYVSDEQHSLSSFEALPTVRESTAESIKSLKELGELPHVADVLAHYPWDKKHADLFLKRTKEQLVDSNGKSMRDEAMVRLAMHGAELGMTDAAIYVVVESFDSRVEKFVGRSDREAQLLKFVEKARAKHPSPDIDRVYESGDLQLVYTFKELLASEVEVDWLIDDFIPRGTINFVSAMSGIGKSRLTMQMAYACAAGGEFLAWKIKDQLKAMYVSLEMDTPMLKHFASQLAKTKSTTDQISDNLLMVPIGEAVDLTDTDFFENLIIEHKPDIMFIDALGSLTLDAIDEKSAKDINNKLKSLIKKYGITFVVIHHNRKDGQNAKDEPTLHSIYGSQYIVTDAAVVLTMHRINSDKIKLIPVKTRAVEKPVDYIVLDNTKGFEFVVTDNEDEESNPFSEKETTLNDIGQGHFFTGPGAL